MYLEWLSRLLSCIQYSTTWIENTWTVHTWIRPDFEKLPKVRLDPWWKITSTWMAITPSGFFVAAHAANKAQAIIMASFGGVSERSWWWQSAQILYFNRFIDWKQREWRFSRWWKYRYAWAEVTYWDCLFWYQEPTSIRNNACYPTAVFYSYQNSFHPFS